ncbi:MAG: hypothetical protein CL529_12060 [Aequorivita sp.]|nr:hypothetical protein [Aequorivita sp.]|tara:strand:+ start:3166 stop:3417 length:252 start_codon:yes stop_codon:yes gene_type:complete
MILQLVAVAVLIHLFFFLYVHGRLNQQDKYLETCLKSFAEYKGIPVPQNKVATEIIDDRKPEVYSPRHDPETIMQGKVIDPFD